MKNNQNIPAGHCYTIEKQLCNLIPGGMVKELAEEYGVAGQSRTFSGWSHVVALEHAQITYAIGLNDVCDSLQMHRDALSTIRWFSGTVPAPSWEKPELIPRLFRRQC
jgi:hypothetical protein